MKCEEFDPETYVRSLLIVSRRPIHPKGIYALDGYCHLLHCETDSQRLEDYFSYTEPSKKTRRLINNGIDNIRKSLEEIMS